MANYGNARARIESAIVAFAATIGSLPGTTAAVAQEPAELNVDVGKCAVLKLPEERFACYEAAVDAAKGQLRPSATPQSRAAESAPASTTSRVEDVVGARAAQNASKRRAERNPGVEFAGIVAALRETIPNAFLITLDNGQVWRQVRPKAYPLRSGHKVRLYSTGWGSSYRLEAETVPGYIQVERVK